MLLRVPGLGVRVVDRIVASRRLGALRLADVGAADAAHRARYGRSSITPDWTPRGEFRPDALRPPAPRQLDLFA